MYPTLSLFVVGILTRTTLSLKCYICDVQPGANDSPCYSSDPKVLAQFVKDVSGPCQVNILGIGDGGFAENHRPFRREGYPYTFENLSQQVDPWHVVKKPLSKSGVGWFRYSCKMELCNFVVPTERDSLISPVTFKEVFDGVAKYQIHHPNEKKQDVTSLSGKSLDTADSRSSSDSAAASDQTSDGVSLGQLPSVFTTIPAAILILQMPNLSGQH